MRVAEFDRYMTLWYEVMLKLVKVWGKRTDRLYGCASERLFSCWLHYQMATRAGLRVMTAPHVYAQNWQV
jgi:hypothetical protein